MIDNYDSFTYNLVQYMGELGADLSIYRNDRVTVDEIRELNPEKIVISPGPCTPDEAGVSVDTIRAFSGSVPILGVCLGHQSIGRAFGGEIVRAPEIVHGKTSRIFHDGRSIFKGIDDPFDATRYHSLIVSPETMPDCLEMSAWTENGLIMGLRHREHQTEGVQFHPESVLTRQGKKLIANFLSM